MSNPGIKVLAARTSARLSTRMRTAGARTRLGRRPRRLTRVDALIRPAGACCRRRPVRKLALSTESAIVVAMFTITDRDAAVEFYTGALGWQVRTDVNWGGAVPPMFSINDP